MGRSIELSRVFIRLTTESQGLERGLKDAEKSLGKFSDYVVKHPAAVAGSLGVALLGLGVKAVQAAEQVEAAFRKLDALVPGLAANMKRAQAGVAALAEATGRSQQELLATAEAIARNGVEGTDDLLTRLRVVTNLGRVTGTETAAIAAGLDQVMDTFGLAAEKADEAGARLFAIAKGKAPLEDLFAAIQGAAPGIRQAGLSFDVAAQALATLLAEGKSPKQAATELKAMAAEGEAGKRKLEALAGVAVTATKAFGELDAAVATVSDTATERAARFQQAWSNALLTVGRLLTPLATHLLEFATTGLDPFHAELQRRTEAIQQARWRALGILASLSVHGGDDPFANKPPGGLTPEEQARLKELRAKQAAMAAELRDTLEKELAGFTESLVDDSVAATERFRTEMSAKLAALAESERATLQKLVDQVLAAMEARTLLLRAAEGIRTTPRVVGGGAGAIPLRTDYSASQKAMEARTKALAEAEEQLAAARREALQEVARQVQAIEQAGRGALQLAESMGILSDEAASAAEAVLQIASSATQLSKLSQLGATSFTDLLPSVLSIAGGLASLIGSLFGESPEEAARREVQRANTEAIKDLSKRIGELGEVLGNTAGSEIAAIRQAILNAQASPNRRRPAGGVLYTEPDVQGELEKLGLTLSDLQALAAELHITLRDRNIPSFAELQAILEALARAEITQFATSLTGQLQALGLEFELFDITNPIEQLKKLQEIARRFGTGDPRKVPEVLAGLGAIDITTEAGRAAADKEIQRIFDLLVSGGLDESLLGDFSVEQLLEFLKQFEGLIDSANQTSGPQGQTSQFAVQRTITEVQANLLASLLTTDAYWNEQTARNTAAIVAALGASIPTGSIAPPVTGVGGSVGTIIDVTMYLTLPTVVDLPTATAIGGGIADGLAARLDAQWGAKLRTRRLLSGDVTQV